VAENYGSIAELAPGGNDACFAILVCEGLEAVELNCADFHPRYVLRIEKRTNDKGENRLFYSSHQEPPRCGCIIARTL
jgi:hypothetical protein